jgi:5-methylcytosine-specific restriction endonuclease McrA
MGSKRRSEDRAAQHEAAELRRRVLERDRWHCQQCGSLVNLHVHHIVHRSQLGASSTENLVTLCAKCHRAEHGEMRSGPD